MFQSICTCVWRGSRRGRRYGRLMAFFVPMTNELPARARHWLSQKFRGSKLGGIIAMSSVRPRTHTHTQLAIYSPAASVLDFTLPQRPASPQPLPTTVYMQVNVAQHISSIHHQHLHHYHATIIRPESVQRTPNTVGQIQCHHWWVLLCPCGCRSVCGQGAAEFGRCHHIIIVINPATIAKEGGTAIVSA
jgi:hypothetical protein